MDDPSELESLYPFPDDINIRKRACATKFAEDIFAKGAIDRCLVIWVDGSVAMCPRTRNASRLVASAVRYLDLASKSWVELITFNTLPYGSKFALEAEIIAVSEAFRIACEMADQLDRVIIFSDCMSFLQGLRSRSTFSFLMNSDRVRSIFTRANSLYDVGIIVELHFVPAHAAIEGNERVHELVYSYRRNAQYIIAQNRAGLILRDFSINPCSLETLRQILFAQAAITGDG